jgi:hypothetical protein
MAKPPPQSNVMPFSPRVLADEPEAPIALPIAAPEPELPPPGSVVDLTGRPKVWLVMGPRAGKTTLLRWVGGEMTRLGGSAILAACDARNRSLKSFAEPGTVIEPPGSDARLTAGWLRQLLEHCATSGQSALVDLGANQTALDHMPIASLAEMLAEGGVATVAIYMLGARTDDLADVRVNLDRGFHPEATALVSNAGMTDWIGNWVSHFERVRRHSTYREAIEAGACELVMPKLDAEVAAEIEAKRLSFIQARDALSPTDRAVAPLRPFARASVRLWLRTMDRAFEPIRSWLPDPPPTKGAA